MPRYGQTAATPEVVLPPVLPPSETVLKLRADVRLAYISQFVNLFAPHVNLEFNIEVSRFSHTSLTDGTCCSPSRAVAEPEEPSRLTRRFPPFEPPSELSCCFRRLSDLALTCDILLSYRTWKQTSKGAAPTAAFPPSWASCATLSPTTATQSEPALRSVAS